MLPWSFVSRPLLPWSLRQRLRLRHQHMHGGLRCPLRPVKAIRESVETFENLGKSIHKMILGRTVIWVRTIMGRVIMRTWLLGMNPRSPPQQQCATQSGGKPAGKRLWHGCFLRAW